MNKFLSQLAYIEAKTYINIAATIIRASLLIMLVAASVISHMKLQLSQIRILDEIKSIGF